MTRPDDMMSRWRPLAVPALTAALVGAGWWLERQGMGGAYLAPASLVYYLAFGVGGFDSARTGLQSLLRRRIDIDFLMVAAALGAAAIGRPRDGAVLIFIFALSNALEAYALSRTRRAIEHLVNLRPLTARRLADPQGEWRLDLAEPVAVDALRVDDVVAVLPGERIPADSVVVQGSSAVDTSAITGESLPRDVAPGVEVLAGCVNLNGLLWLRVRRVAAESALARIIHLVAEAQERKAPTQLFIERFEQRYAFAVVVGTLGFIGLGLTVMGWGLAETLYRAMTVMVVASPCAVVLSTMPAMLSAVARGARHGVLFKGALYLEQLAGIKVVAFDKTGTLTFGRPEVVEVVGSDGWSPEAVLGAAASAESGSEHPIARAIVGRARELGLPVASPTTSAAYPGRGVEAVVAGDRVCVGSPAWFAEMGRPVNGHLAQALQRLQEQAGHTAMVVSRNGSGPVGVIAVADRVRPEATAAVTGLKALGVEQVVVLTGDHPVVARRVAHEVGADAWYAELLPEQKMQVLHELERQVGPVAMVGDGINDAPALATASVGVAMGGAGTDVALETADVVLMADELPRLEEAIAIGRQATRIVRQNLAFAFSVIGVLLVAAATGHLSLAQGVIGHEGSTVLVALNGLRLLGFRWRRSGVGVPSKQGRPVPGALAPDAAGEGSLPATPGRQVSAGLDGM